MGFLSAFLLRTVTMNHYFFLSIQFIFCLGLMVELQAQHITSSFISKHIFSDLSTLQMTKECHWFSHDRNIDYDIEITVHEAYYGCSKEVTYKRMIQDPSCEVVNCPYCKNKGVIFTKTVTPQRKLEQHLQSPCPVCLGRLKAGKDGCRTYKEQLEKVLFEIPRGARVGYQLKYPTLGNAMLDYTTPGNFTFTVGDLLLRVGAVTDPTKTGLNVTKDGMEIEVTMEPLEALEGFTRQYAYFDEKVINIDKTDKTTLPETELIMPDPVLAGSDREGLLIRFTLLTIDELKEKLDEELLAAEGISRDGTVIESQRDFDKWEASKKDLRKKFRKDVIVTKFLMDIKRRQDEEGGGDELGDDDEDDDYSNGDNEGGYESVDVPAT